MFVCVVVRGLYNVFVLLSEGCTMCLCRVRGLYNVLVSCQRVVQCVCVVSEGCTMCLCLVRGLYNVFVLCQRVVHCVCVVSDGCTMCLCCVRWLYNVFVLDVGDFVPFRFRAIKISCHFGDFVPPIGSIRVYFHTY